MSIETPDLYNPTVLAQQFNKTHAVGWTPEKVLEYMFQFDVELGETMEEHLECFADHDLLVLAQG